MPPIDPSLINDTVPAAGEATTASVRANESATKVNFQAALDADLIHEGRLDAIDLTLAGQVAAINANTDHRNTGGNPHGTTAADVGAEDAGAVALHDQNLAAHTGLFEPDGATATHDADVAAHGAVEDKFNNHEGSRGAAHDVVVVDGDNGFMTGAQARKLQDVPDPATIIAEGHTTQSGQGYAQNATVIDVSTLGGTLTPRASTGAGQTGNRILLTGAAVPLVFALPADEADFTVVMSQAQADLVTLNPSYQDPYPVVTGRVNVIFELRRFGTGGSAVHFAFRV